jgi:hypothetical protein
LQTLDPIRPEAPIALTALHELEDAGGHSEAFSIPHQQALRALMQDRLVRRVVYKAGLVIYEITKAGRRVSAAYPRPE